MNIGGMIMVARSDWNRMGPKLPTWLRPGLARIDAGLVPQFIPARSPNQREGVDPRHYPHGVWTICKQLPGRSRWLFKRWVWNLQNPQTGLYEPPGRGVLKLLRLAKRQWHKQGGDIFEQQFGKALQAYRANEEAASKKRLGEFIRKMCCYYDERLSNRVSMHGAAMPSG